MDQTEDAYNRLLRKVTLRLLPFMFVLYIISYLDRINISFAGAPMSADLHFNEEIFGLGAGIFFFGYCLFGVPSNLALQKIGARKWISLIMVVWGFVSVFMAFVPNTPTFFAMRFLLGAAEAGFFPGMIFYLTKWFRKKEHGMAVAKFMSAIPAAGILGGLIAAKILAMPPLMGLPPWKWLFIITGSPAILLGLVVLIYLPDGPEDAKWLSAEEKLLLESRLGSDSADKSKSPERKELFKTLFELKVWLLAMLYFSLTLGMYGFQLWLPQIISATAHGDDAQTALLSAIPAVFQALGMVLIARNSDRTGERRWHLAASASLAVVGLVIASVVPNPVASLAALCLTAFGIWGTVGPFWALPTAFLSGASAAAAIALINSIGNLGGFAGPYIVGAIKHHSPNFGASLLFMAGSLLFGAILAVSMPRAKTENQKPET
ncbi:MAG: MFS transporter [Candidatus Melainabacteria bacterium]|nr:MFS transporter [Candidatus Melainabacteria bacterium]